MVASGAGMDASAALSELVELSTQVVEVVIADAGGEVEAVGLGVQQLPEAGEELTLGRFGFRVARADARRLHALHVSVHADH